MTPPAPAKAAGGGFFSKPPLFRGVTIEQSRRGQDITLRAGKWFVLCSPSGQNSVPVLAFSLHEPSSFEAERESLRL